MAEGRRENDAAAEKERAREDGRGVGFAEFSYAAPLAKCAAPRERGLRCLSPLETTEFPSSSASSSSFFFFFLAKQEGNTFVEPFDDG